MKDRNKAMQRVKALLARTASDSEEEARTCALFVCKMIQEYGFEITDPERKVYATASSRTNPFTGRPPSQRPFGGSLYDIFNDAMFEELRRRKAPQYQRSYRVDDFTAAYEQQAREAYAAQKEEKDVDDRKEVERRRQEHDAVRAAQEKKAREEERKEKEKEEAKKCPANQPSSGPKYKKKNIKWQAFPADFPHECTGCGRKFKEGDPVVWAAGFGTYRAECIEKLSDSFEFTPHSPDLAAEGAEKPSSPPSKTKAPIFTKRTLWTKQYSSAYDGVCRKCSEPFSAGTIIRWVRGFGSYHPRCWTSIPDDDELVPLNEKKAYTAVKEGCRGPEWEAAVENAKRAT